MCRIMNFPKANVCVWEVLSQKPTYIYACVFYCKFVHKMCVFYIHERIYVSPVSFCLFVCFK